MTSDSPSSKPKTLSDLYQTLRRGQDAVIEITYMFVSANDRELHADLKALDKALDTVMEGILEVIHEDDAKTVEADGKTEAEFYGM